MTDRELLELAAQAAGYIVQWDDEGEFFRAAHADRWEPLTDNGDALQLLIDAKGTLCTDSLRGRAIAASCGKGMFSEPRAGDLAAATRRAIVRAAAEIARSRDGSPLGSGARPDQTKLPESGGIGVSSIGLGAEGEQ